MARAAAARRQQDERGLRRLEYLARWSADRRTRQRRLQLADTELDVVVRRVEQAARRYGRPGPSTPRPA
jgi:hypothetical protein